ncbi:4a-hydroxytetrahydrobiopterin dehydratase [Candidatus Methylacidithermus pantelleriae]|uniref:Putative pterin-4-alpha-carbinolamine dehydratase n=1 Tax=Candidatus Methylacidithermus pantelleriae TaxID=2744239 RepID=A0A8J2BJE4_9BACT|nr:4a-hydroxytetrahydrobiopterin dehydratase [Candidatus Methylacidithermus pantelleriae]CAF0689441.1 Putative pterin-4-alpha-carbinolamine dehydratase [Candidatus Methylacidithermus pantelleriae]
MAQLAKEKCTACRVGAPQVSEEEAREFLQQLPGWEIVELDGIRRLKKVFRFPDFAKALAFTQRVGELAEQEGHHPAILLEWGRVTVQWWTHKIKGLHRNDFIMAAKTDELTKE